jgi:hypothetical protein
MESDGSGRTGSLLRPTGQPSDHNRTVIQYRTMRCAIACVAGLDRLVPRGTLVAED